MGRRVGGVHRPGYRLTVPSAELVQAFAAVRAELELPAEFPPDALAEAERAAREPSTPDRDLRSVPFVTLDPPGARDLDQAMHIERAAGGYRVRYAIADVPAFVPAGGAVDREARARGQTMYAPDGRIPLHPPLISEGAASLLPGQDRRAFVWDFDLDASGSVTDARLSRALVRSEAQLDYAAVQRELDSGSGHPVMRLLAEVGPLREEQERLRGGASLAIPDQEIETTPGGYSLRMRPPSAIEGYNAQISLMTGMQAARIMLDGGVGLLRTMPPAPPWAVDRLRRQARALGAEWPERQAYGEFLRSCNADDPRQLAVLYEAVTLFRGAGYTAFDGDAPTGDDATQAAVAAPYAHVTAPLRRLVDRFALVCCEALIGGAEVPAWVREALPLLGETMQASDRRAGALERACVDVVEAALLCDRVGETFTATVVDKEDRKPGALVQLTDPPVLARCDGELELGTTVQVRLDVADVQRRLVRFSVA